MENTNIREEMQTKETSAWLYRFIRKIWYRKDLMLFWGLVATLYVMLVTLLLEKYVFS